MSEPANDKPVACSLGAADLERRLARWKALDERALAEVVQMPDGWQRRYRAEPGVEIELRELVRLEGECCAFLEFDVDAESECLVLRVRGDVSLAHLH